MYCALEPPHALTALQSDRSKNARAARVFNSPFVSFRVRLAQRSAWHARPLLHAGQQRLSRVGMSHTVFAEVLVSSGELVLE